MKTVKTMLSLVVFLAAAPVARAHEAADGHAVAATPGVIERPEPSGLAGVEGAVVVPGTVRALKGLLLDLPRWPALFADVRGIARGAAPGTWAVDFRRFGHPHTFVVARGAAGVVLELAQGGHGVGRLEYRLQALDAGRSRFTVRYTMAPPPGVTREAAVDLLRAKAAADLADLARAAAAPATVAVRVAP